MIPINSSNISLKLLIRQLFVGGGRNKCEEWFRNRTGKKHILLTYSCRSALYLAYAASEKKGKVITSPLTCSSAIDPIVCAGNNICFCDTDSETLLMDPELIESKIDSDCSFIQAIHHGGLMMDMERVGQIARQHNMMIIEDCGQAFNTSRNGIFSGTTGDVACFSMIKCGYGIGGGALATDDTTLYENARMIQASWRKAGLMVLLFRSVRAILENNRQCRPANSLYHWLLSLRPSDEKPYDPYMSVRRTMRRPSNLFFRIFALQSQRFNHLHEKRRFNASIIINKINNNTNNIRIVSGDNQNITGTFDKLFCIIPVPDVSYVSEKLNRSGVETRHLENKYRSYRQPRFDELNYLADCEGLDQCGNYLKIHDRILNLPLHEKMDESDFCTITSELMRTVNEENNF